jgi:hypothetical protein
MQSVIAERARPTFRFAFLLPVLSASLGAHSSCNYSMRSRPSRDDLSSAGTRLPANAVIGIQQRQASRRAIKCRMRKSRSREIRNGFFKDCLMTLLKLLQILLIPQV